MDNTLKITLTALDKASSVIKNVDNSLKRLGTDGNSSGHLATNGLQNIKSAGESLTPAFNKASTGLQKIGTVGSKAGGEASKGLDSIRTSSLNAQAGLMNLTTGFSTLKSGVSEVINQVKNLNEVTSQSMMSQQMLKMNLGSAGEQRYKDIRELVKQLPGDDASITNTLIQGSIENREITQDGLKRLGEITADLMLGMKQRGKNSMEAEQDALAMITGDSGELMRNPFLKDYAKDLEEATTLTERMNIASKALQEQGIGGLSKNTDNLATSLEKFDGMLTSGTIDLGTTLGLAEKPLLDLVLGMNDATGGLVGMTLAAGGFIAPAGEVLSSLGQMSFGLQAIGGSKGLITALSGSFNGLLTKIMPLSPVILGIGAAIAIITVAVYELGKAFGWWNSVNDILEAINSGVKRLWSALVNNQDLIQVLGSIKDAWNKITQALQPVINDVLRFFRVQPKGKFDIVRSCIMIIGAAWHAMTPIILLVIKVIVKCIRTFTEWYWKAKYTINYILELFRLFITIISSIFGKLYSILTAPFKNLYNTVNTTINKCSDSIKSLLDIDLSGLTQIITDPIDSAYHWCVSRVNDIKTMISSVSNGLKTKALMSTGNQKPVMTRAYGGPELEKYNLPYEHNIKPRKHEVDVNINLTGLKGNVSEDRVKHVIRETLNDNNVINTLINNSYYQYMNNKYHTRRNNKIARAGGL